MPATEEPADSAALELSALAGTWVLDPDRSSARLRTKAMWFLPVNGVGRLLDGSATVAEDGTATGSLRVDAASFHTGNAKRDQHLRSEDFFHVDQFPTFDFEVTGARLDPAGTAQIAGTLTILGRPRPVALRATTSMQGSTAVVSATTVIDRSDWEMSWSKMGAGLQNLVTVTACFAKV